MASAPLALAVGQIIELNDGRLATVRFQGTTAFAPGNWIGVELESATGKNDGAVKGDRYFECEQHYGMFLRAAAISRIVEQPESLAPAAKMAASLAGGTRSPTKSPTKQRTSANGSLASSRANTPPIPTSLRSSTTSTAGKPSLALASTGAAKRAPTISSGSATARPTARPSISGSAAGVRDAASARSLAANTGVRGRPPSTSEHSITSNGARPKSKEEDTTSRQPSISSERRSTALERTLAAHHDGAQEEQDQAAAAPLASGLADVVKPTEMRRPSSALRKTSPPAPVNSQRPARQTGPTIREVEELQTKLRLLERRRLEDREKLKTFNRIQTERDRYETIVNRMQQKYKPQQEELAELKRQLATSTAQSANVERLQAEHDEELENATLDREMAEEQYEVLSAEVAALRLRNEEMELEVEVLKEENLELSKEMSPEERTSQGWLQLERSNERLREALVRLRDMTQEQEQDLRAQIKMLEKDVAGLGSASQEAVALADSLAQSEAAIEALKQQLELAQGGEEMIEELSDRNMTLQESVEELKASIEDLESLRELNDELEVNHIEAEKQMQDEIDFKDSLVNELTRRSSNQQKSIDDYELTLSRFREAFRSLQADLEDMRASQQISETEAEDLSSKSRALIDLNMKLQVSASKTQISVIDMKLEKLDALEATQHLAIVQLFLPDAYQAERDSVLALLRFKRIVYKAELVHDLLREKVASQSARLADDDVFALHSVMDRLAWISSLSHVLVKNISACSVGDFTGYRESLYDLEPVERALNGLIDSLKKEDIKAIKVDEELQRSMAVMSHLSEMRIPDSLAANADRALMRTNMVQSHLETSASALSLCKRLIKDATPPEPNETVSSNAANEPAPLLDRLDAVISHIRNAKVIAGKANRDLSELRNRSLSLDATTLPDFAAAETSAAAISAFGRALGDELVRLTSDTTSSARLSTTDAISSITHVATSVLHLSPASTSNDPIDPFPSINLHLRKLSEQMTHIATLSASLSTTTEFDVPPAPWILRSATLKDTAAAPASAATDAEIARLSSLLDERSALMRATEQALDEAGVRIETLEARARDAGKKSRLIEELEDGLAALKSTEAKARTELARLGKDAARLRTERDEWRAVAEESMARGKKGRDGGAGLEEGAIGIEGWSGAASRLEVQRKELQVQGLQSAVRFLTKEVAGLRRGNVDPIGGPAPSNAASPLSVDSLGADMDWLSTPLTPQPATSTSAARSTSTLPQHAAPTHHLLQSETSALCLSLLEFTTRATASPINLTALPANKLAWRPAAQTTAWKVDKRREEWEVWREWRGEVLQRASLAMGAGAAVGAGHEKATQRRLGWRGIGSGRTGVAARGVADGKEGAGLYAGTRVKVVGDGVEVV